MNPHKSTVRCARLCKLSNRCRVIESLGRPLVDSAWANLLKSQSELVNMKGSDLLFEVTRGNL